MTTSLTETPLRPSRTTPTPLAALAALIHAATPAATPAPLQHTPGAAAGDPREVAVTGITLRAQHVRAGDLFAALPSLTSGRPHGADFSDAALAAGAAAILTDPAGARRAAVARAGVPVLVHPDPREVLGVVSARIYQVPSTRLAVLGVTGTSGKTTTTYLLEAGLRAAGANTGLLGTVQARIGEQVLPSVFTTPEAPDLQALLALMVERGVTHLPIEVSSHALALGRVAGVSFAVGAFTNLSQDHLDFHGTLEDYFAAKGMLFDGRAAVEVVCVDDQWGRRLVTPNTVTVSSTSPADWRAPDWRAPDWRAPDWRAEDTVCDPDGTQRFWAHGPDGLRVPVTVRLAGAFNVTNALLALAVGHTTGADPVLLARGIATAEVPGRMQRVDLGQDFLAVVDYAHKPAAVSALLAAVREQVSGRVLVVLGCGGNRDAGKRPLMGAEAARQADLLVVTDDNPRDEDPAAIRAAMLAGARGGPAEVVEVADRASAIEYVVTRAGAGDAVVVAGKGHETGQQVRGVRYPFSDVEVLAGVVARRGSR